MQFIETQVGLVAGKHIVRISAVTKRLTGSFHEIDYVHGGEPRTTRATADAVQIFLDQNSEGRS